MRPGKTGETFVVEQIGNEDYLLGVSTGSVSNEDNTERLTVANHPSAVVKHLYNFLIGKHNGVNLAYSNVTYTGNPLIGQPMVSITTLEDETGALRWLVVAGNPESDFYESVLSNSYVTAALSGLVCITVRATCKTECISTWHRYRD